MNDSLAPHEQRVVEEYEQLNERLEKLGKLLVKEKPDFIDDANWELLNEQFEPMDWYRTVLIRRIRLFKQSLK